MFRKVKAKTLKPEIIDEQAQKTLNENKQKELNKERQKKTKKLTKDINHLYTHKKIIEAFIREVMYQVKLTDAQKQMVAAQLLKQKTQDIKKLNVNEFVTNFEKHLKNNIKNKKKS